MAAERMPRAGAAHRAASHLFAYGKVPAHDRWAVSLYMLHPLPPHRASAGKMGFLYGKKMGIQSHAQVLPCEVQRHFGARKAMGGSAISAGAPGSPSAQAQLERETQFLTLPRARLWT